MILVSADSNGNLPDIVKARLTELFGGGGGFDGPAAVITGQYDNPVAFNNSSPPPPTWTAQVEDVHVPDRGEILAPDPTDQHSIKVVKRGLYMISMLAGFRLGSVDPEGDFVLPERCRCKVTVGLDMNSGDFGPAYYPYPTSVFELDPAFAPRSGQALPSLSWSFLQPLDVGDSITLYLGATAEDAAGAQVSTGNIGIMSNDLTFIAGYAGEWAVPTDD